MRYGVPILSASVVLLSTPLPAADMPAPQMLAAAGAQFPVVSAGAGEPVLFVHGSFSDYRIWGGLWEDVAKDHRFIAYTRRGFGTGDWPESAEATPRAAQVADLVAILRAGGEPAHLVAWSNGGQVALMAAAKAPDLVRSIVIYEPTLLALLYDTADGTVAADAFEAGWAEMAAAVRDEDFPEAMREAIEYAWGLPEGGFATLDVQVQAVALDLAPNIAREQRPQGPPLATCDALHGVAAPVLLIVGSDTLPVWTLGTEAAADCLPDAEIAVIDGAGHGGPVQAKDAFVKLTLDFIDAH